MAEGRDDNGRFMVGNAGGPGRPRRAVEREYLAALSDAIGLDGWRAIVDRAVQDATAGDARARAWLATYLLGTENSMTLLAAREALALDADLEIAGHARLLAQGRPFLAPDDYSAVDAALDLRREQEQAEHAQREAAERQRRRLERAAQKAAQLAAPAADNGSLAGDDDNNPANRNLTEPNMNGTDSPEGDADSP